MPSRFVTPSPSPLSSNEAAALMDPLPSCSCVQVNIDKLCPRYVPEGVLHALGYVWGQPVAPLLEPLHATSSSSSTHEQFDVIILADLIFNRSEHDKLLWTCRECLKDDGVVWVAYSHHDPHKKDKDLEFFTKAEEERFGFLVKEVGQVHMQDLFIENDGLDDQRGIVYLSLLTRRIPLSSQAVTSSGSGFS